MNARRHWVRGALGGFCLGLGLIIMFMLYGVIRLGDSSGIWILLASTAFGVVWSLVAFGPRKPKAAPDG
jgi:hypothetical protein